jgi:threonine dehydratase
MRPAMHVVHARAVTDVDALAVPPIQVPVDDVCDLSSRFPEANLRPLTLVRARELDQGADSSGRARVRVWLALESLQVTGSFKVRGALTALAEARRAHGPKVRVVAASAGNHGAGVAYAAGALGIAASVVMPEGAPLAKRSRVIRYGAELVQVPSPHYDDAEAHALALAKETGAVFLSPYDDAFVAAGNGGSLGFEIARALGRVPDVVLCPFGGGGLAAGLGWAFDHALGGGAPHPRRVWGVQSEASPAMALSLTSGTAVTRLEAPGETLAEGLEGGISVSGFARARGAVGGVIVVSEGAIGAAMAFAFRGLGLVLEGSAATSLVPILGGIPEAVLAAEHDAPTSRDVVAVLTGRNVDRERLLRLPLTED